MPIFASLLFIVIAILFPLFAASAGWHGLLGIVIPCAAWAVFVFGFVWRVVVWARSPVPFRIPVTSGQQRSLSWIKADAAENPSGRWGVALRMFLEVALFRSLFRNTRTDLYKGRPVYGRTKNLWLFGWLFHASFLVILVRHLRLFSEPVVPMADTLAAVDGMFEIGVPTLYLSDLCLLAAAAFLLLRRIVIPRVRYISLAQDYIPLLLVLCIAGSGLLMRHFDKIDLVAVKELASGWICFVPTLPEGLTAVFFVHLFCVSALLVWFPLGKLMHMGGVFLSPTRNLANDSRRRRHVNPWNAPVKVHTYEEYEEEFRNQMKAVGLPVDKE
ncbi:MAG: menaquinol oxidoreductase [Deltaproteobacteria bacterium HGW-Deltaproteobacteria-19]|jgi:nitrate reductase gamma subunit|nr:MAG: menaquinol oxidoreductase [Deltaproteobacteria bacterium HGW-Deltaproteobacteria-19]